MGPGRNASPECWQLYGEVQGFALYHLELVRDSQQLTVDAYAAQHAPREVGVNLPPIAVTYALVGLHLALDCGLSGREVRAAHQRMGKPDPSWPPLPAPERTGAMTVFDVAAAGAIVGSAAGHAKTVQAWAAAGAVLDPGAAAVQAGELSDQRQADPRARCVAGDIAALLEGLEDLLAKLGRHARSLVLHQ